MKKLEQKILKFIEQGNLISPGDKIVVALSGGPDSVFALRFLYKYKKKFNITLAAFHLNHCLRGKDADADEKFCAHLCSKLDIELFAERADIKTLAKNEKKSVEEAARNERYERLDYLANEKGFTKIVTAHNSNDNAETMLLNLFTGCGLHGISGIPVKRGIIIRPLLNTSKEEILEYLKSAEFKYRIDRSNLSNDYKRNFLRNKIIPILKREFNPKLEDALFRSSRVFDSGKNIIEEYVDSLLNNMVQFSKEGLTLLLDENLIKEELAGFIIRHAISKRFGKEITFNDILTLRSLEGKQAGRKISLSSGLSAFRERDKIEIFEPKEEKTEEFILGIGERIEIGEITIGIDETDEEIDTSKNEKKSEIIEADNINDIFILRVWKNGDRFVPLGMRGFKKISDFLTDQKVSSSHKKNQLLLLNRNNIVWVVGLKLDDRYKIRENTKRKLKLWIK